MPENSLHQSTEDSSPVSELNKTTKSAIIAAGFTYISQLDWEGKVNSYSACYYFLSAIFISDAIEFMNNYLNYKILPNDANHMNEANEMWFRMALALTKTSIMLIALLGLLLARQAVLFTLPVIALASVGISMVYEASRAWHHHSKIKRYRSRQALLIENRDQKIREHTEKRSEHIKKGVVKLISFWLIFGVFTIASPLSIVFSKIGIAINVFTAIMGGYRFYLGYQKMGNLPPSTSVPGIENVQHSS